MKINFNSLSILRILFIICLVLIPLLSGCSVIGEAIDPSSESVDAPTDDNPAEEDNILYDISVVIGLLLIASLVSIVTTRLRVPYTVGLVLISLQF